LVVFLGDKLVLEFKVSRSNDNRTFEANKILIDMHVFWLPIKVNTKVVEYEKYCNILICNTYYCLIDICNVSMVSYIDLYFEKTVL